MDGFRDGKIDILVATDIAAHGIDVPEVSHVINFDMPDTVDAYTRRIGRTGRAHQTGEAFTLAVPSDEPMVREVEKVLKASIERRRLLGFGYGDFNPETQFPQRRPDPHRRNGRRFGSNSGNHSASTGQDRRQASRNSSGTPSIARGTRSGLRRRPSNRRG